MIQVTKDIVKKVYPKKDPWSHKGDYGKLLVISGSYRITGAPILVSKAALRAGVDTVYLAGPKRAMDVAANSFPTFINLPLEGNQLEQKHLSEIADFADEMGITAVAIGPGLWRAPETRKAIIEIVKNFEFPMVIDADAIRAMSGAKGVLKGKTCVLTPHANEFAELTGVKVENEIKDRTEKVSEQAKILGTTILLKGHVDVIADDIKVATNKTNDPRMSKGGTGDTMTGICAAFLARRTNQVDAFTAACAAAYMNGRAGQLAAKKFGVGLLPTDLVDEIPNVIKEAVK